MEYIDGKGAAQIINEYMEKEMSEFRKITEKELKGVGIAPEAKAAFNRKPYYSGTGTSLKSRPVVR